MSEGIIKKNRFRQIVRALRAYAVEYLQRESRPFHRLARTASLPPPLAWAALRGEGIVRLRFCQHFESLGFDYADGEALLALWPRYGCHHGLVFDLLARGGVFAALDSQFRLPEPSPELAWQIYCGMVDALERSGQVVLLDTVTKDFWQHHWQSQFPEEAPAEAGSPTLATLRQRLHRALQARHGLPVELREQFQTDHDRASFCLRYRLCPPQASKGEWQQFSVFDGTRLKPIKFAAYQAALEETIVSSGLSS